MKQLLIVFAGVLLASCNQLPKEDLIIEGLKPVYVQENNFAEISSEAPKAFNRVGKIYKQGNYILISDIGTGVHIIDNSDPSNPQKVSFINIPGNNDMLARFNAMYADNGKDLVTIDISNLDEAHEVNRIENVYPIAGEQSPPSYEGHFECVDPANGVVVAWEEAELINPKCEK